MYHIFIKKTYTNGTVRGAYERLLQVVVKYVKGTSDDVKKMVDHAISASPSSATESPEVFKYEDYKHIKYWFEAVWQTIRNKSKGNYIDSSVLSAFMEDEFGKPISEAVKARVRSDIYSYWTDVHDSGEKLCNWTDIGLRRKDHYRRTFEERYPWLRLCEASWKVDHLWINHFRGWKKNHPELKLTETPEPANPLTVVKKTAKGPPPMIDITSSSSSDTESSDPPASIKKAIKRPPPTIDITSSSSSDTESSDPPASVKKTIKRPPPTTDIPSPSSDANCSDTSTKRQRDDEDYQTSPKRPKTKGKGIDTLIAPVGYHYDGVPAKKLRLAKVSYSYS
jgi:hypothetical protein